MVLDKDSNIGSFCLPRHTKASSGASQAAGHRRLRGSQCAF